MMKRISTLTILALLLVGQSHGQDSIESRARLSSLQGVYIDVEPATPEMEERGMTTEVIYAEVERSLRGADIPVLLPSDDLEYDTAQPTLYVGLTTLLEDGIEQCVYGIRVELMQTVKLERSALSAPFYAATWSTGGVGFYRQGWRQAIIDDVTNYVELFAQAYHDSIPIPDPSGE